MFVLRALSQGLPHCSLSWALAAEVRRQLLGSGSPVSSGATVLSLIKGGRGTPLRSATDSITKRLRQFFMDGGASVSSGLKERPSTNDGVLAPARSAKVGARSLLSTM